MKYKLLPLVLGIVAFAYYVVLSSKSFTWLYTSADSADWLVIANWWMVPQPLGSPLFLLLCQAISHLPGNLLINMTVLLSCLPSAISVSFVYLITKQLTGKVHLSVISSLILLGSMTFLTQSTVLELYAITTMFLTISLFFLSKKRMKLFYLFLGFGAAVHSSIFIVTFIITLIILLRGKTLINLRRLIRPVMVFIVSGILPYSLILLLMHLDTPRFFAGPLDWYHLNGYFIGIANSVVGTISVFDFPQRILSFSSILISSLFLSLIPLVHSLRRPYDEVKLILISVVGFYMWYYLTCFDPATWPYLIMAFPAIAIMVGVYGLTEGSIKGSIRVLKRSITVFKGSGTTLIKLVTVSSIVLIILNGVFMNANTLTNQNPVATTLERELIALPEDSVVVTLPGATTMTVLYVMSKGKYIVPLMVGPVEYGFKGYQDYLRTEYGIVGDNIQALAKDAESKSRRLYLIEVKYFEEEQCFILLEIPGNKYVKEITGFTEYLPSYYHSVISTPGYNYLQP